MVSFGELPQNCSRSAAELPHCRRTAALLQSCRRTTALPQNCRRTAALAQNCRRTSAELPQNCRTAAELEGGSRESERASLSAEQITITTLRNAATLRNPIVYSPGKMTKPSPKPSGLPVGYFVYMVVRFRGIAAAELPQN